MLGARRELFYPFTSFACAVFGCEDRVAIFAGEDRELLADQRRCRPKDIRIAITQLYALRRGVGKLSPKKFEIPYTLRS